MKRNREPLLKRSAAVAVVSALIAVLVAFGLPITAEQTNAILGLVAVVAPIVLAYWARRNVTPLADPQNEDGEALVTLEHAEEILEVQPH